MTTAMSPLATALSEVLADMAFMFPGPPPEEPLPAGGWLECAIGYRGPHQGDLRLRCPARLALVVASNLLDLDPEAAASARQAADALKELLNVICGQLVIMLYGRQAAFDLDIPRLMALAAAPGRLPDSPDGVEIYVEGYPLQLVHTRA